jgi:hypothetical protein
MGRATAIITERRAQQPGRGFPFSRLAIVWSRSPQDGLIYPTRRHNHKSFPRPAEASTDRYSGHAEDLLL